MKKLFPYLLSLFENQRHVITGIFQLLQLFFSKETAKFHSITISSNSGALKQKTLELELN
jgi:hypothetical protein